MDFALNEDQALLKTSIERYFADNAGNKSAAELWQDFNELGWLAMPFNEESGGYGGGIIESCLVMEAMGKQSMQTPYWSSVLMAGQLLQAAAPSTLRNALLNSLLNGEQQLGLAYFEQSYADTLADISSRATASDSGWVLNGSKVLVANPEAETLILIARTGETHDTLNAFAVSADHPALNKAPLELMDGSRSQTLHFEQLELDDEACLFPGNGFLPVFSQVLNEGIIALAAEAQGAMDALLYTTVEYARNRKQFGVAIGSFQALQHRMVDMYTDSELCRAMVLRAQCAVLDNSDELDTVVAALKTLVGKKSRKLAEEAVQLHGGMGVSEELPVGQYLRRLMMIDACLGNADLHRRRFCQLHYPDVA